MTDQERDFKGVWIPKEVWLDERLNALDKIILTEIDSLDNNERGCWASNKYIADFCQCSESKVSKAISKLISLDYIYLKSFDGRQRELKSRLSNYEKQISKICEADYQIKRPSNTRNNTTNNKDINNISAEFETLWALYPRKIGKPKALKAYEKARKNGATFDKVKQGIEAYNRQIEALKTNAEYIKHGSTWFNNEGWNDEYQVTEAPQKSSSFDTDEFFNAALRKAYAKK